MQKLLKLNQNKTSNLVKKYVEDLNRYLIEEEKTNGKRVYEEMFDIICYQGTAI